MKDYMRNKFLALFLFLPICVCLARDSLEDMRRENEQHMDRIMDQHYQSWDRIERHLEQEEQKRVNRSIIEGQNRKLFGDKNKH